MGQTWDAGEFLLPTFKLLNFYPVLPFGHKPPKWETSGKVIPGVCEQESMETGKVRFPAILKKPLKLHTRQPFLHLETFQIPKGFGSLVPVSNFQAVVPDFPEQ